MSDPYYVEEAPQKTAPKQNWKQATSARFNTYEAAKEAYNASEAERKRVRRRAGGYFDFVVYEPLPESKEDPEDE